MQKSKYFFTKKNDTVYEEKSRFWNYLTKMKMVAKIATHFSIFAATFEFFAASL